MRPVFYGNHQTLGFSKIPHSYLKSRGLETHLSLPRPFADMFTLNTYIITVGKLSLKTGKFCLGKCITNSCIWHTNVIRIPSLEQFEGTVICLPSVLLVVVEWCKTSRLYKSISNSLMWHLNTIRIQSLKQLQVSQICLHWTHISSL